MGSQFVNVPYVYRKAGSYQNVTRDWSDTLLNVYFEIMKLHHFAN